MNFKFCLFLLLILTILGCKPEKSVQEKMKVKIKFFERKIEIFQEDKRSEEYLQKCIEFTNAISERNFDKACKATCLLYNNILPELDEETVEFSNPREILNYLKPISLIIPEPQIENEPICHLELHLEETSIEWIIRGNTLLFVGEFVGEDPWSDPSTFKENLNNYASEIYLD